PTAVDSSGHGSTLWCELGRATPRVERFRVKRHGEGHRIPPATGTGHPIGGRHVPGDPRRKLVRERTQRRESGRRDSWAVGDKEINTRKGRLGLPVLPALLFLQPFSEILTPCEGPRVSRCGRLRSSSLQQE